MPHSRAKTFHSFPLHAELNANCLLQDLGFPTVCLKLNLCLIVSQNINKISATYYLNQNSLPILTLYVCPCCSTSISLLMWFLPFVMPFPSISTSHPPLKARANDTQVRSNFVFFHSYISYCYNYGDQVFRTKIRTCGLSQSLTMGWTQNDIRSLINN